MTRGLDSLVDLSTCVFILPAFWSWKTKKTESGQQIYVLQLFQAKIKRKLAEIWNVHILSDNNQCCRWDICRSTQFFSKSMNDIQPQASAGASAPWGKADPHWGVLTSLWMELSITPYETLIDNLQEHSMKAMMWPFDAFCRLCEMCKDIGDHHINGLRTPVLPFSFSWVIQSASLDLFWCTDMHRSVDGKQSTRSTRHTWFNRYNTGSIIYMYIYIYEYISWNKCN